MGWGDVRYCFAMAILVILIILLLFFTLDTMATAVILMEFEEENKKN
jgi:hypothetical protein